MPSAVRKLLSRSLYVRRNVTNASDIIAWAKAQGFGKVVRAGDMHATLAFSRMPVNWILMGEPLADELIIPEGGPRVVEPLGKDGAIVLHFASYQLALRHGEMQSKGALWDYDEYQPHITLTYEGGDVDLSKVEPYRGEIRFGPEIFEEVKENWSDSITEKAGARHNRSDQTILQTIHDHAVKLGASCEAVEKADDEPLDEKDSKVLKGTIVKVDEELGLVFGWAIISKDGGKEYYDQQGDHIPEDAMLKASATFMERRRVAGEMHRTAEGRMMSTEDDPATMVASRGSVVFAWPLTSEIAKAMGIKSKLTGLMIGMKPDDPAMLGKCKSGEYTGFSIGGGRVKDEEVD